jgi:hypothetical protein
MQSWRVTGEQGLAGLGSRRDQEALREDEDISMDGLSTTTFYLISVLGVSLYRGAGHPVVVACGILVF